MALESNGGWLCLAINGRVPVEFYGRLGGIIPLPDDIEAVRVGGAYNFPLDDLRRFAERNADAALDVQRRKLRELLTDAAVAPSAGGRDTGFRLVRRLRWNRVLGAPE